MGKPIHRRNGYIIIDLKETSCDKLCVIQTQGANDSLMNMVMMGLIRASNLLITRLQKDSDLNTTNITNFSVRTFCSGGTCIALAPALRISVCECCNDPLTANGTMSSCSTRV